MMTPPGPPPFDGPTFSRNGLIHEARRHQRLRRQIIGAALATPLAIGGLFVGLNLSDTGRQAAVVVTPSVHPSSQLPLNRAIPENLPSALSPSNVVVLNPATGDVIEAQKSEAAAALKAAQSAVAAQSAKLTGNGQQDQTAQVQAQIEFAQAAAQAAAAAAATGATQTGRP
jgi:hypothetical protein